MGKLILVRHGESQLNTTGVFYGWLDPDLTELGKKQGMEAGRILEQYNFDEIYSSDLKRAAKTAEFINRKKIKKEKKVIEYSQALRELNFGIFEGMLYKDILKKYPEEEVLWRNSWAEYNYETGESVKDLQVRVIKFIENLDVNKDIVIVAHWGVINVILSYFISGDTSSYWKFSLPNGGIAILDRTEDFTHLVGLNIGG